ncbi:ATP/GTP-binding protein [Streptomyces sp. NPDC049881]|uniref:GTP-binding protein n=1 Tax=unclassified Streptomyces TaxID=2593676 RepID=UPI00343E5E39
MNSVSDPGAARPQVKILVAGGFGAGKTTMVGSLSEITPLTTEETLTQAGEGVDRLDGVERKSTTTVAMDFGRITLDVGTVLLFGTPGQDRFWFMWRDLVEGALGAILLADSRRLADAFPAADFFDSRRVPYVVAVNCFDGRQDYTTAQIAEALQLDPDTPVLLCDARRSETTRDVLLALMTHCIDRVQQPAHT